MVWKALYIELAVRRLLGARKYIVSYFLHVINAALWPATSKLGTSFFHYSISDVSKTLSVSDINNSVYFREVVIRQDEGPSIANAVTPRTASVR